MTVPDIRLKPQARTHEAHHKPLVHVSMDSTFAGRESTLLLIFQEFLLAVDPPAIFFVGGGLIVKAWEKRSASAGKIAKKKRPRKFVFSLVNILGDPTIDISQLVCHFTVFYYSR